MKKLLEKDYKNIIIDAFNVHAEAPADLLNYFENIYNECFDDNNELPERLKSVLNQWKDWFNENQFNTNEPRYITYNGETFENRSSFIDENGKRQYLFKGVPTEKAAYLNPDNKQMLIISIYKPEYFEIFDLAVNYYDNIKYLDSKKAIDNLECNKKVVKGFALCLSDGKIRTLFDAMNGVYFDTDFDNFKLLFNDNKLTDFKTINKKQKFTNTQLIYFANELFMIDNPNNYVNITERCFGVKNLSKSQSNCYGKPQGKQDIDNIIELIK
jgi:hypothetical protein